MSEHQNFKLVALYEALDVERSRRQMSWAGAAEEVSEHFRGIPTHRSMSSSTIKGLRAKKFAEGDGVLQMLLWLGRTPESFVPGVREANAERFQLRVLAKNQILRWDTKALHSALNAARQANKLTWREVADEVGGVSPAMLTNLAKGGRTSFPSVMRIVGWLGQPGAAFTLACDW